MFALVMHMAVFTYVNVTKKPLKTTHLYLNIHFRRSYLQTKELIALLSTLLVKLEHNLTIYLLQKLYKGKYMIQIVIIIIFITIIGISSSSSSCFCCYILFLIFLMLWRNRFCFLNYVIISLLLSALCV